jgi:hypothetical protein
VNVMVDESVRWPDELPAALVRVLAEGFKPSPASEEVTA